MALRLVDATGDNHGCQIPGATLQPSRSVPNLEANSSKSSSAENVASRALKQCLARGGLKIEDERGITTEQASAMRELGASIEDSVARMPFIHQPC